MPTLAFGRVDRCVLLVHSEEAPTDREWDAYIDFVNAQLPDRIRILVVSNGGTPSAPQRNQIKDVATQFPDKTIPTAVITTSVLARGAVTAINWFFKNVRAFAPMEIAEALKFLEIPPEAEAPVQQALAELQAKLSG